MICNDIFPNIYNSPSAIAEYKSKYLQVPRITSSARAGGSVATRSKKMQHILQSRLQNPTHTSSASYAAITRTKVVFDLHSDFPALNQPHPNTFLANIPTETSTVASDGSSTLGPGIPKTTSASIVSQDVSTIVGSITSEIKSMFNEQSTENRKFQQYLFDKQSAKDELTNKHIQAQIDRQALK
jgi:hypothetical protein